MVVGVKILIIIALMGGLIAYMGDKLGTKVGKRRMSLFGLRPKHTSIIVTIVTGLLVAAATVGVLSFTSQSVRTALFGMDQLRADMKHLNEEVAAKTQELIRGKALLEQNKQELEERMAEIEQIRREVEATKAELASAQAALQNGIIHLREGTILFQVDQLLAQAVVRPGLSAEDSNATIKHIIDDTNQLVLRRLGIEDQGQAVVYVDRQNIEVATQKLIDSKTPMVVQVVAAGNIISGEPAVALIQVYPQQFIYKNNEVIHSTVMDGGSNAQASMLQFLKQVNEKAKAKGVIPDSLSGDIGTIPGDDLFTAIRRVSTMHGKVHVEAYVDGDTYSSGPVHLKLRITQMPALNDRVKMQTN